MFSSSSLEVILSKPCLEVEVANPDACSPSRLKAHVHDEDTPPPAVPPKSPLRAMQRTSALITIPQDDRGWLPIGEWARHLRTREVEVCDNNNSFAKVEPQAQDPEQWQNVVSRMKTATLTEMLHEIQGRPGVNQTQDAHQEIQKQRWMVYALHHLDRDDEDIHESTNQPLKVLVLFDSTGEHSDSPGFALSQTESLRLVVTSHLAFESPKAHFYHLSHQKQREIFLKNVTSLSIVLLPLALPTDFDVIQTLSLPALCPSAGMVQALRCLRSHLSAHGGALHVTLIDALPHPTMLGPCLRRWLETNLMVHLKASGLEPTPTRTFPRQLAAASLRGPGSRRVKTKFYAAEACVRTDHSNNDAMHQHEDHDPDPAIRKLRSEMRIKAELRCLVGRMLWKEVWGRHLRPKTVDEAGSNTNMVWWWEDAACMAECAQLGTFWEYHSIEAVRAP